MLANFIFPKENVPFPRDATQSAVLPRQVVRPSVCPAVTLRYRDHICENNFTADSATFPLSADPNITDLFQRKHPQILAGIGVG